MMMIWSCDLAGESLLDAEIDSGRWRRCDGGDSFSGF
jgi:hypothetical protein